ncbi:MAG: GtrA family protein [Anaerolineae bacterium]|nr:GtrA family protein [Anaerolineae bacterium]
MAQTQTGTFTSILARRPRLRPLIRRVSVKYGGEKHKELERFLKFAFVGLVGTVVDFGIFNVLIHYVFHVRREDTTPVMIAQAISFTIAVGNNFIWNRYWTYPDSRSHSVWTQLVQFFVVNVGGLLIRAVVIGALATPFAVLVGKLPADFLHNTGITADIQLQLGSDMALIGSIAIVMLWNFFVNRYWTYNDVH